MLKQISPLEKAVTATLCEDIDNGTRQFQNVSISQYNFPGECKRRLFIWYTYLNWSYIESR